MAKQVKPLGDSKSFSAINDYIGQFDPEGDLADKYQPLEIKHWFHTGSYINNAHISGSILRGMPEGRVWVIAGDPKTGKSFVALNTMRWMQNDGYFIWMVETENSPDKERFKSQMLDPSGIRITQPESASDLTEMFIKFTDPLMKMWKENLALVKLGKEPKHVMPKIAIIVDSISGFISSKQYGDAGEGEIKTDRGFTANELSVFMKMSVKRCGKLGIPMICTAHTTETQVMQFKTKKPSGAVAVIFMASIVTLLEKKKEYDEVTKTITGIDITSSIYESRYSKYSKIHMYIRLKGAMNPYVGLDDYVSWDACGIDKGKFIDLVDIAYEFVFKKLVTKDTIIGFTFNHKFMETNIGKGKLENIEPCINWFLENGYIIKTNEFADKTKIVYAFTEKIAENFEGKEGKTNEFVYKKMEARIGVVNKNSSQIICKHLGRVITPHELFSDLVFTPEVLKQLDENVIKNVFPLPSGYKEGEEEAEDDITDSISSMDEFFKIAEESKAAEE